MGQKVHPHGLRVGVIKDWDSRWYARADKVGDLIVEDYKIRNFLKKTLYSAGVPTIEIERDSAKVRIYIHCSRPGVVIGKAGAEIENLRKEMETKLGKSVNLNIVEVRSPDLNAQLVAENIAQQLSVKVGAANLNDVEVHALAQTGLHILAQVLDFCTGLTDDNTGAGAVDVDLDLATAALDLDLS